MASWLSRALTWRSEPPATPSVEPLPEAEVRRAVESAKHMLTQGDFERARAALRKIVISNPNNADALAHYGVAAYSIGDPADAQIALSRAVQLDRDHVIAHKYLAAAYHALGDLRRLGVAARDALRVAPRDREILNLYGVACMNRFEVEAAADSFSAAVELAPNDLSALLNLETLSLRCLRHRRTLERSPKIAVARTQAINRLRALYRRNQLDDAGLTHLLMLLAGSEDTFGSAVETARKVSARNDFSTELADELAGIFTAIGDLPAALRFKTIVVNQDSSLPLARSNLAYTRLYESYDRWGECWKTMREQEVNFNLGIFASEVPTWTGQRLGKKKILVYQDQGIGDAILALRLIPMLAKRGVRFDLWVRPVLAGLAQSVGGFENLIRSENRPDARALGCDFASTLFGLISALGVSHQEIIANPTVLVSRPECAAAARSRLRELPGRRIGLAYGGNPERRDDWYRTVPAAALKPLAGLEGISWVNLAVDKRADKAEVIQMLGMCDPMEGVANFEDTAAIISELDAVVAVDSSVAHLAAALGKPVWVLVSPLLDWRWQVGNDTRPWWPTVNLLRCPELGDWKVVIEKLTAQLAATA